MMEFTKKEKVIVMIAIVTVVVAIVTALAVGIEYGKQQCPQPAAPDQILVIEKYTDAGELVGGKAISLPFNGTTLNSKNPFEMSHNVTKFHIHIMTEDVYEIGRTG